MVQPGPIFAVMDAHCALCAKGARWIARNDTKGEVQIVPIHTDLGQSLLKQHDLDPNDPASWLYVDHGEAFTSLDAYMQIGRRLGGKWRALGLLKLLPRRLRDALYYTVARNRYALFGRTDLCQIPDTDLQQRLVK